MTSVLFICTGNICRSPMAEGFFRHELVNAGMDKQIRCDSAGLIDYHEGNRPDSRAIRQMHDYGIDISSQRSRPVLAKDYLEFDYIIAMDKGHFRELKQRCERSERSRISLMMQYSPGGGKSNVPDPYYGDESGFTQVAEMLQPAIRGLIQSIQVGSR